MILRILGLCLLAASCLAEDDIAIAGSWTGDSICTGVRAACQNEHVIWTFKAPDSAGHVEASADKVVDGKRVNMGIGDFQLDRKTSTLTWKIPLGVWKLTLKKNTIEGILTQNDGAIARNMNLVRDK